MTNIVVQCHQCKHQFKTTDDQIGDKFHCYCGEVLTVPSVKSHDAAVVRCSSCGGARGKKQEPFCRYCGSSFTLHERDLNTICPHCMTRISSAAKFCHSCATAIAADDGILEDTQMPCPNCDNHQLHSRQIPHHQSFTLKECSQCVGIWISADVFNHLEKEAQVEAHSNVMNIVSEKKVKKLDQGTGKYYRNCPKCHVMMNRKNYAQSSGILVDVCSKHGIWFDMHELNGILNFIRSGKLLKYQKRQLKKVKDVSTHKKTSPLLDTNFSHNTVYDIPSSEDFLSEIINWLTD